MTALWHTLSPTERATVTCMATMLLGLFIGAAVTWWQVRTPQVVADDLDVAEYETRAADAEWAAVTAAVDPDFAAWETEVTS